MPGDAEFILRWQYERPATPASTQSGRIVLLYSVSTLVTRVLRDSTASLYLTILASHRGCVWNTISLKEGSLFGPWLFLNTTFTLP